MREWTIGELISQSFEDFKKNMGVWIAFTFAIFVISLVVEFMTPDGGSIVISIISFIINSFIGMVFVRLGLAAAKGENIDTQGLFADLHLFIPYLILSLITTVAVGFGTVLFIVPGIYLALAFIVAQYALIDKNMKCIPALKESMNLTTGHKWHLLGYVMVLIALNIGGAMLLLVGLLVTIPLTILSTAHLYLILSGAEEMVDADEVSGEIKEEISVIATPQTDNDTTANTTPEEK